MDYQRLRKHKDRRVTTEKQSKTYRFTYNKRVILKNGYTVPYGFEFKVKKKKKQQKKKTKKNKKKKQKKQQKKKKKKKKKHKTVTQRYCGYIKILGERKK